MMLRSEVNFYLCCLPGLNKCTSEKETLSLYVDGINLGQGGGWQAMVGGSPECEDPLRHWAVLTTVLTKSQKSFLIL